MPHIAIKLYPGRTDEVKKDLAEKTRDFFVKEMNLDAKYFSVEINETEKENWDEEVVSKINQDDLYVEANF